MGAGSGRAVGVSDFSSVLTEVEKCQEGEKKNPFRLIWTVFAVLPLTSSLELATKKNSSQNVAQIQIVLVKLYFSQLILKIFVVVAQTKGTPVFS